MYCTIADLKAYTGITGTTDDLLLYDCIQRAQALIERKTGRVFEVTVSTTHYFDALAEVCGSTLWFDDDCCSITTVTNGDADSTVITSAYYTTKPVNSTPYYAITLKGSSGYSWQYVDDPENAIQVSGKWGYSATPPEDIVQACVRLAAYLYRQKDQQVIESMVTEQGIITVQPGLPKDIEELLRPYKRRIK